MSAHDPIAALAASLLVPYNEGVGRILRGEVRAAYSRARMALDDARFFFEQSASFPGGVSPYSLTSALVYLQIAERQRERARVIRALLQKAQS